MKSFSAIVACLVFLCTASLVHGQDTSAWKEIKLGPMFMPGISANAGSVTNGEKTTAVNFSWSVGALADFPFNETFGLQAGIGYDARSVEFHDQKTADTSIAYTFNYFSIRPELRIGDFLVGIGLGIPIGASTSVSAKATATKQNTPPSLGATSMNLMVEGRVGVAIPLMESDNGNELKFLADASFAFNSIVSNSYAPLKPNDNNISNKTNNNGPLATLQLGFAYLFNLNPH